MSPQISVCFWLALQLWFVVMVPVAVRVLCTDRCLEIIALLRFCASVSELPSAGRSWVIGLAGVACLRKIWGFHGGDYEEGRLLGYKNPVRTSQETHYVSATGTSQLMLCKIWDFHGSDYEEYCLLGYKNPFLTSQETLYVSATELNRLKLCKFWDFLGGEYEEWRLLWCYAVWLSEDAILHLLWCKFRAGRNNCDAVLAGCTDCMHKCIRPV
jgi:hypothetical protein